MRDSVFLATRGHRPRKRFGQHFLVDGAIVAKIMQVILLQRSDHVVEIGPGEGVLTQKIVGEVVRYDAIEIDRDLACKLESLYGGCQGFYLHCADALTFDLRELLRDAESLRLVGNLPYNITTPLLFHLVQYAAVCCSKTGFQGIAQIDSSSLEFPRGARDASKRSLFGINEHCERARNNASSQNAKSIVQDMHFMVQREVAERLVASPGSKTYGRLSVMMQYYAKIEKLFDVAPSSFVPVPKVYSSFIRLTPFKTLPIVANDEKDFALVVQIAFNQRRKTIRNSLKALVTEAEWRDLSIDPGLRPEELSLEQFIMIGNIAARKRVFRV